MAEFDSNVVKIVVSLKQIGKPQHQAGYNADNRALNVIDCILSLNRRYDSFVIPRKERFAANHPDLKTLNALHHLILQQGPKDFMIRELNYNFERSGRVMLQVVLYLLEQEKRFADSTEAERLNQWAVNAKAEDYEKVNIKYFGLAGFQYLRILFGAQTAKPDIYVKRWVSAIVGRKVDEWEALNLLEAAAEKEKLRLTDYDYEIWLQKSHKSPEINHGEK
jgi:hypothetical protein